MHGVKLLTLANVVGLSQSAIASHFGITRVQVHRWAHGQRPIPQHYLAPLMELVYQAYKRYDAALGQTGDAFRQFFVQGEELFEGSVSDLLDPTFHELRAVRTKHRALVRELLEQCIEENMELRGEGATASIASILVALEAFKDVRPTDLRKPIHAERLAELARSLAVYADIAGQLGPLLEIVTEEQDHAKQDDA